MEEYKHIGIVLEGEGTIDHFKWDVAKCETQGGISENMPEVLTLITISVKGYSQISWTTVAVLGYDRILKASEINKTVKFYKKEIGL